MDKVIIPSWDELNMNQRKWFSDTERSYKFVHGQCPLFRTDTAVTHMGRICDGLVVGKSATFFVPSELTRVIQNNTAKHAARKIVIE